jgi:hypothetical protein
MKRLLVLVAAATIAACGSGIRTANPVQPGTLTFSMSGTISELDEDGARPSSHATVDAVLGEAHFTARTNESGWYELTGLPAGDWFVTVTKAGYLESLAHVTVTGQTTADFAILRAMTRDPRESEERRHVPR